jgi:hypothetical protein
MFVDTVFLEVDRRVFADAERALVEAHPDLAVFSTLTGAQVIGLLGVLGEYAIRAGHRAAKWKEVVPGVWDHPNAVERHDALARFWWTRYAAWCQLDEPDVYAGDVAIALPDSRREVFLPATKEHLALHKYIKGLEGITLSDLCVLLGRVAGYAGTAQPMPALEGAWIEGPCRRIHGHNQILRFAQQPFTYAEFVDSSLAERRAYEGRTGGVSETGLHLAGAQMGVTSAAVERLRPLPQASKNDPSPTTSVPLHVEEHRPAASPLTAATVKIAAGAITVAVTVGAWYVTSAAIPWNLKLAGLVSAAMGIGAGIGTLKGADRLGLVKPLEPSASIFDSIRN